MQRGTKIVVHLRGDCYNYAKEEVIKGKYNNVNILNKLQPRKSVCKNIRKHHHKMDKSNKRKRNEPQMHVKKGKDFFKVPNMKFSGKVNLSKGKIASSF